MSRSTHYTPPLSRFNVSALYHEAKQRRIPMTRLANDLIELALKETPGWKEAQAQEAMRLIDRFRTRLLSDSEALQFASNALLLRYDSLEQSPIDPRTLLSLRRAEDQGSDLWTTFNRVQENLVRGGLSDGRRNRLGRLRTLRALSGIDSKIRLNKGLWSLAEQTANALN